MTIHSTLKSDVAIFMARDDLADVIPTIVRLAESRIRKDVRVRAMETASDITISSQSADLPENYLAAKRFYISDATDFEVDYLSPSEFWSQGVAHTAGKPVYYTIEGDKLYFAPYPSGTTIYGKMLYWRAFDALSGEEDTNWLLTNHYDIYLYACLAETKAFIEDDEQAGKWATAYSNAKDKLNESNRRSLRGQSTKRVSRAP